MKSVIWSLACVVALYGAGSPAAASPAGPRAGSDVNDQIEKKIEQRLHANASLKAYNVKAEVNGGIVTLTGTVATEAQKARAGQLARVAGVTRVDNQITVDPEASTRGTTGMIADKAKEGAEKTKEGAKTAAEKTKEGAVKVGSEVTDAYILTRVKSKFLGEDLLKGSDINVDCDKHIVTLRGTVTSEAGRARAIEQAKEVEGVTRVVDKLTIGPKK
jgi:osmotically-inducible protein OsmY